MAPDIGGAADALASQAAHSASTSTRLGTADEDRDVFHDAIESQGILTAPGTRPLGQVEGTVLSDRGNAASAGQWRQNTQNAGSGNGASAAGGNRQVAANPRPDGVSAVRSRPAAQSARRQQTEAESHIDTYTAVENEYRQSANATTIENRTQVPVNSSLRAYFNHLSAGLTKMRDAVNEDTGAIADQAAYDSGLAEAKGATKDLRDTQSAIDSQTQGERQNQETHRISSGTKWILGAGAVGTTGIALGTGLIAWNNAREATHPASTGGNTTTETNNGNNTINNNSTTNGTTNSTTNAGPTNGNTSNTTNGTMNQS